MMNKGRVWLAAVATVSAAAAAAVVATGAAGGASAASAKPEGRAATSCATRVEEQWVGTDVQQYRVIASCSTIAAHTKVRGVLDIPLLRDKYTEWFTATGTGYASKWAPSFVEPTSRIETQAL